MADDTKTNEPSAAPTATPAETPLVRELELPMASIMKGGTVSLREEKRRHLFMEDTKARWAEVDEEAEAAKEGIVHDRAGNVVAATSLMSQDIGAPNKNPVAILGYVTRENMIEYQQVDVTEHTIAGEQVDPTFVFVCPECIRRGVPQTDAQLSVRKSNKSWDIDKRCYGELFADEVAGNVYTLAGLIECHERCRCPGGCGTTYTIGGTRLPDGSTCRRGATLLRRVH